MHVVHVSSELAPFAKAGGLGDVVFGLSHETVSAGIRVSCILPFYDHLDYSCVKNLKTIGSAHLTEGHNHSFEVRYWTGRLESLEIIFIESLHPHHYFRRGRIYGEPDDPSRFLHFCFLACHALDTLKLTPDVFHLHDWPTAFLAPYLKTVTSTQSIGIVLTIHNALHQGLVPLKDLQGFPHPILKILERKECHDPEYPEVVNLLRSGIEWCDVLTTVSPTYAKEIQTPEFGYRLHSIIKNHNKKLYGILNGIDDRYWNPTHDRYLKVPLPKKEQSHLVVDAKLYYKKLIREKLHLLCHDDAPLFCSITRLDYQKSPKSISYAAQYCAQRHVPYVILGDPSTQKIDDLFIETSEKYKEKHLIRYYKGFHEEFAHLLFAAADYIFIPSLFEPCGLTQMIGMRYGTIPIVRRTGGLIDSVIDINENTSSGTGIIFHELSEKDINESLEKALSMYLDKSLLGQIRLHGMSQDLSWKKSIKTYLSLYKQSLKN